VEQLSVISDGIGNRHESPSSIKVSLPSIHFFIVPLQEFCRRTERSFSWEPYYTAMMPVILPSVIKFFLDSAADLERIFWCDG